MESCELVMGSVLNLDSYIYSELSWKVLESIPAARKQEFICTFCQCRFLIKYIKQNSQENIDDINLIKFSEFQVLILNKKSRELSRSNLCELSNVL